MALSKEATVERRSGIAATDAAPILGISPFKSAAEVWVEKKRPELVEFKESKAMYWGLKHEQTIAEEYTKVTGQNLLRSGIIHNKNVPWMMCSPDFLIEGKKKGVETKTADSRGAYQWGPAGTDMIPQYYLIQVQHSIMVANVDEWDVAALIGGNDFRIYHIFRDMELMKIIYEHEKEFYTRFIKGKEVPTFDWGKGIAEFLRKKYPQHDKDEVLSVDEYGDEVLKKALLDLMQARSDQSVAGKARSTQEALIKSYMEKAYKLEWKQENIEATWKTGRESVKIDWRAVFEELAPQLPITGDEKKALLARHTKGKAAQRRFLFKYPGEDEEEDGGDE